MPDANSLFEELKAHTLSECVSDAIMVIGDCLILPVLRIGYGDGDCPTSPALLSCLYLRFTTHKTSSGSVVL
jgi:hypothetical protein